MKKGIFRAETFSDVIEKSAFEESPKRLWKDYWFENETCILFADSNQGKSILAVDIAINATTGKNFWGQSMSDSKGGVLYFDFELSSTQFSFRYSKDSVDFPSNLIRVELDQRAITYELDETIILDEIEYEIRKTDVPKIIIIDNITYLCNSLIDSKRTSKLMKGLKYLKEEYDLSILILAHTPKRNQSKPITQNDLQGSKMLMNFCDSAIAIGSSTEGKDIKYLKHIKARSVKLIEEVAVMEISDTPYLHMNFLEMGEEEDHLQKRVSTSKITEEIGEIILEMDEDGYSVREIGNELAISKSSIGRYLQKIKSMRN